MKKENPEYDDIRRMMEDMTGRRMQTPKDFELLSVRIYERTGILLSVSTLKRFWGYVAKEDDSRGNMRQSTLNTFASYVGFSGWDSFCRRKASGDTKETSNLFYGRKQTTADHFRPGETMIVMWKPDRCITIRYSGNDIWVVTESKNSKLSVGDTFRCHVFVETQPLVLVDLVHEGMPPCGFVCGKDGGITFQIINPLQQ